MAYHRKFELTINIDNAAFADDAGAEVARILHELGGDFTAYGLPEEKRVVRLKDRNGARVGFALISTYEED